VLVQVGVQPLPAEYPPFPRLGRSWNLTRTGSREKRHLMEPDVPGSFLKVERAHLPLSLESEVKGRAEFEERRRGCRARLDRGVNAVDGAM
jgi:hypothetical protein